MTNDPLYVIMFENLAVGDDGEAASERAVEEPSDSSDSDVVMESEPAAVQPEMVPDEPAVQSERTAADFADISTAAAEAAADFSRPADEAPGTSTAPELPAEALSLDQLQQWAIRMFCGGREQLVASGGARAVSTVSLELIMAIKATVIAIFKDFVEQICSSPERPDLRLTQEEALGHLVGSLVVGEMLATEARGIGKRLDFHAGKEAKAQAQEKESVRQKLKGLRKKKGLEPAQLTTMSEAIDVAAEEARALRLAKVIDLGLPAANSQIVERRAAPKLDPIAVRRRALETMLGSQLAFDAILAAERVENAEQDLAEFDDDGRNPVYEETSEEYELELVHYKHALARLKEAYPNVLNDCAPDGTCEHRRPCPCGRGMRGAWPWVVQTPRRGYCDGQPRSAGRGDGEPHEHFWSCDELAEERARWEHMLVWADPAHRAELLDPERAPGQCRMPEAKYREQSERIRRELY